MQNNDNNNERFNLLIESCFHLRRTMELSFVQRSLESLLPKKFTSFSLSKTDSSGIVNIKLFCRTFRRPYTHRHLIYKACLLAQPLLTIEVMSPTAIKQALALNAWPVYWFAPAALPRLTNYGQWVVYLFRCLCLYQCSVEVHTL